MTDWFKKISHLNPSGYTTREATYIFQSKCGHTFESQIRLYNKCYTELCPSCKNIPEWYDKEINKEIPYTDYKNYYNFKSKCGHIHKQKYNTFIKTYQDKCPECIKNFTLITIKETKKYIPSWYDDSINIEYKGELQNYNFKTICNHIVNCTIHKFKHQYKGKCKECHEKSLQTSIPNWWSNISHLNPEGWKGKRKSYNVISKCGHSFKMIGFIYGEKYIEKCPICTSSPWFRWDLNPEGYINKNTPYNFELECGHIVKLTSSSFLDKNSKTICPKCGPEWFDITINPEGWKGANEKYYHRSKCGHVIDYKLYYSNFISGFKDTCPDCKEYNNPFISKEEQEVADYIKTIYNGEIRRNSRILNGRKQIDIYLPDINLAIEYNGIKWHCENESGKDKNYHIEKTNICNSNGIQLLHINSDEWKNTQKNKIWKSIISSKMNKTDKIYARKCSIKELTTNEAKGFINYNHLQGYAGSKIKIGLYHNNELMMVTTFSKFRFGDNNTWELVRCSSKLNITIVGGLSKLLKYFNEKYNDNSLPIMSYADRRYSIGKSYEKVGFKLTHISPPNYKYFYKNNYELLLPRENFQKHKLGNILENFDPTATEWENMRNNGYDRIWDSGNLSYILY